MADIPDEAIAAAECAAPTRRLGFSASAPLRQAVFREEIRKMLMAAAPHLLAAGVSAHRAEQDAVHADLSQLLRVLGMGDHARPQSSHDVMLDAINEAGRLRTRLAEIENAVTWNTSCTSCVTVLDSAYRETCRREAAEAALARVRALDSAAILIGGERYVRADYIREALEDGDE